MRIYDLLNEKPDADVKVIGEGNTIGEAAQRLLARNIGALVVVDQFKRLSGIVSERDVIRAVNEFPSTLADEPISKIMTRSVITCVPHDDASDILFLMKQHGIRHVPVLEAEELVGIISIRDLARDIELVEDEASTDVLTGTCG